MSRPENSAASIRALNDQTRLAGPQSTAAVRWVVTPGVTGLGPNALAEAIRQVQGFSAFDSANDPHGEHDFGAFDVAGERLFWKIDYYDRSLSGGSLEPANAAVTCRVLTLMLASEY